MPKAQTCQKVLLNTYRMQFESRELMKILGRYGWFFIWLCCLDIVL